MNLVLSYVVHVPFRAIEKMCEEIVDAKFIMVLGAEEYDQIAAPGKQPVFRMKICTECFNTQMDMLKDFIVERDDQNKIFYINLKEFFASASSLL